MVYTFPRVAKAVWDNFNGLRENSETRPLMLRCAYHRGPVSPCLCGNRLSGGVSPCLCFGEGAQNHENSFFRETLKLKSPRYHG